MKKSLLVIVLLGLFSAPSARALFEARLTYGLLGSGPDLTSVYSGTASDVPSIAPNYGLGVDAIFVLPVVGLGFGARYENLGFKISNNGLEYKTSSTRTALVLNYRLINTLIFLGPIATYGISHSNNMKWTTTSAGPSVGSGVSADLTPETSTSYTVGVEAGIKLLSFLVGAEVGYEDFKWKKMTDSRGAVTTNPDLNMSGTYAKVLFGFGI
ncbi:MAG: hypothetical protein AABY64_13640 [Bdellovibrionota bacterium]